MGPAQLCAFSSQSRVAGQDSEAEILGRLRHRIVKAVRILVPAENQRSPGTSLVTQLELAIGHVDSQAFAEPRGDAGRAASWLGIRYATFARPPTI